MKRDKRTKGGHIKAVAGANYEVEVGNEVGAAERRATVVESSLIWAIMVESR